MKQTPPKLPLTPEERAHLRAFKVKLNDIANLDTAQLSQMLEITRERANMLKGLAMFQSVPSIGPKVAARVVDMGYYSLDEIKDLDGADFIDKMEVHLGYWEDPCLEDGLILPKKGKNTGSNSDIRQQGLQQPGTSTGGMR